MKEPVKKTEDLQLSEVQQIIWDIYKELKIILEKKNIHAYMLGGTLLGAVRHKGFIPWDDDIDIGIERSEYERLLSEIEAELPPYLRLDTFRNNPGEHHYYFSRVVDTRYQMLREGSLKLRTENVWIDIFPLDGMPDKALRRRLHMLHLLILRARYHISCFDRVNLMRPNRPLSERIIIQFVKITKFGQRADTFRLLEKMDRCLKKYSIRDTNWVVNALGQYKFKEMFPKAYYGEGKMYPFEDTYMEGPEDADAVLTQMYGDYMKIPDDAQKGVHAATLLKNSSATGREKR